MTMMVGGVPMDLNKMGLDKMGYDKMGIDKIGNTGTSDRSTNLKNVRAAALEAASDISSTVGTRAQISVERRVAWLEEDVAVLHRRMRDGDGENASNAGNAGSREDGGVRVLISRLDGEILAERRTREGLEMRLASVEELLRQERMERETQLRSFSVELETTMKGLISRIDEGLNLNTTGITRHTAVETSEDRIRNLITRVDKGLSQGMAQLQNTLTQQAAATGVLDQTKRISRAPSPVRGEVRAQSPARTRGQSPVQPQQPQQPPPANRGTQSPVRGQSPVRTLMEALNAEAVAANSGSHTPITPVNLSSFLTSPAGSPTATPYFDNAMQTGQGRSCSVGPGLFGALAQPQRAANHPPVVNHMEAVFDGGNQATADQLIASWDVLAKENMRLKEQRAAQHLHGDPRRTSATSFPTSMASIAGSVTPPRAVSPRNVQQAGSVAMPPGAVTQPVCAAAAPTAANRGDRSPAGRAGGRGDASPIGLRGRGDGSPIGRMR